MEIYLYLLISLFQVKTASEEGLVTAREKTKEILDILENRQ